MSSTEIRVPVRTASPYDVIVGTGLGARLPEVIGDALRVAVIHPEGLAAQGDACQASLVEAGYEAHAIEVPNEESAKTSDVAAFCWSVLGRSGFTRSDVIVGLGGGSTTDLAGFVAATWLRGVRLVQVPTTLLGMVDAAVGGKTGINTAEGKNLVGAFHEPVAVLCDLAALDTLPVREVISGLAEVLKCGFIADPRILDLVAADPAGARNPASEVLREIVVRAIRVKAGVVAEDLTETAATDPCTASLGREVLNYGHTFGHAVERVERYQFQHGAAVAIGMCFVAELGRLAGRLDDATADRHRHLLELVGLPISYRDGMWESLHEAMRVDKKTRGDALRFVILVGLARPAVLTAPDPALLTAAYAAISR